VVELALHFFRCDLVAEHLRIGVLEIIVDFDEPFADALGIMAAIHRPFVGLESVVEAVDLPFQGAKGFGINKNRSGPRPTRDARSARRLAS